jgi:hypothetical protein
MAMTRMQRRKMRMIEFGLMVMMNEKWLVMKIEMTMVVVMVK